MTTSVDVLEVLRSQLSWIGPCRPDGDEIDSERWDRIEAAIAAAADLIDAVEADLRGENFDSSDEKWSDYSKRRRQERNRVANALASFKGA